MTRKRAADQSQMDLFKARGDQPAEAVEEAKAIKIQAPRPPPENLPTHIIRRRLPLGRHDKGPPRKSAPAGKIDASVIRDSAKSPVSFDLGERGQNGDGRMAAPSANAYTASPQTRLLKLREVLDRVKISRSLLYELIRDSAAPFPAPVHMGRRSMWIEDEVEAYLFSARSGRTTEC